MPTSATSAAPSAAKPLPCKAMPTPSVGGSATPTAARPSAMPTAAPGGKEPQPVPTCDQDGSQPKSSSTPTSQVKAVPRGGAATGEGQTGPSAAELAGGTGLAAAGLVALAFAARKRRAGAAR